jgi:hypothetical protein
MKNNTNSKKPIKLEVFNMRKFNKTNLSRAIGISIILFLLYSLILPDITFSNHMPKEGDKDKIKNNTLQKITDDPFSSLIDVNNITLFVQPTGFHFNFYGGSWSSGFPKGTAGGIYQEGIVWGGLVNDGQSPTLRVGGNTYFSGTQELDRLYRVRPDFQTADLTDDAANFYYYQNYPLDASAVNSGNIQEMRDQYAKDWLEWPADKGAPFEDRDGNGIYEADKDGDGRLGEFEPDGDSIQDETEDVDLDGDGRKGEVEDIPGIPGASQTIWIHYDDALAPQAYGTPPIGIDVTQTFWAYSVTNPLSNVIFKKVSVIYKGTVDPPIPPNSTIDDMYLVQWADPDIGQYTDDFAGCDPDLDLGYAYSSSTQDAIYRGLGLAPPALGYDFLQGVAEYTGNPSDSAIVNFKWRKGYKYVHEKPLTTYTYFAAGGAWQDPTGQDPEGSPQWYNLMRGLNPQTGSPFPTNVGGTPTGGVGTYLLSGDPITGTGFVDGVAEGPGDRRIVNVHGPFDMALNDTVEIVTALIGGIGSTNTSSIAVLKFNDIFAQYAYDQLFDLPIFPAPTLVSTSPTNLNQKVVFNWDTLLVENASPKGYTFQGYNVYQFPNASFNLSEAIRVATFDVKDGVTTILDDQFDEGSGLVLELPSQFGTDIGIQRFIEITTDAVRSNQPLRNGQEYYFGISAYGYNPEAEDEESQLPFKALESSIVRIIAVPQQPTPGLTYSEETGAEIEVTHAEGLADGGPVVTVVDPAQLKGHDYEVFFSDRQEIRDENGDWIPGSTIISRPTGYYGPDTLINVAVDVAAVFGPQAGTLELQCMLSYDSPDFDWVDGVKMTFPEGTVILSAPNFTTGNDGSNYSGIIAPEIIGNVIMMGDSNRTGNGSFTGGETWSIIITGAVPLDIDWKVYDDGYGGGPIDAEGTTTVTDVGFASRLALYWNLQDVTAGEMKLSDRSEINGTDLFPDRSDIPVNLGLNANPVVDGMQINLDVGYAAPTTILNLQLNGSTLRIGTLSRTPYDLIDFTIFGYPDGTAATSLPVYGGAGGTTVINDLQQDYEIRWTGVTGDSTINGHNVIVTKSGGSLVTLFGASGYSLGDHPLNPNPGLEDPFTIRVPFEVWNVDTDQQVNMLLWDRNASDYEGVVVPQPGEDNFEVWKTQARAYLWVVNTSYATDPIDPTSQVVADNATWNWVFGYSTFTTGDVININYANPIQIGVDTYTFSTPDATSYSDAQAKMDVDKINVFPNPYYGFHYRETTREGKYVTFSHLPARATIRIFDLAGVLVRTIDKNDESQFTRWNLQNNNNYPVASGIYIVYIDMPGLGTTKILKLALIQEEQILRVY